MKKLLLAFVFVLSASSVHAQGTVNFDNLSLGQPILAVDGSTVTGPGAYPDSGAGLYLVQGSTYTLIPGSTTTFFGTSGEASKYVSALTVTIPNVAPGATAALSVGAWIGGSSYDNATGAHGRSAPFVVVTGGAGSPPSLPADMTGFTSFSMSLSPFPEPSTIAFAVTGGLALLLCRRKS
jgi:hypothetical protein